MTVQQWIQPGPSGYKYDGHLYLKKMKRKLQTPLDVDAKLTKRKRDKDAPIVIKIIQDTIAHNDTPAKLTPRPNGWETKSFKNQRLREIMNIDRHTCKMDIQG